MVFYSFWALCAFLIALLGTRLTILALRKRTVLIDVPNLRSNHRAPTPKGGGIAVVMALVIALLGVDADYVIVLALLMLAAVSLLDDLIGVPVIVRLIVQIVAVSIPLSVLKEPVFGGLFPAWLDVIITGALWVWFINLFNFMDGIDGLAATETICIGVGLCLVVAMAGAFPNPVAVYGIIAAAAAAGFLWWNWHPAKIFLGDVGSIPIGFLLGYLLFLAATSGYGYAVTILPAYYFADSGITLMRRLWRRKKIWIAHSEHYYQQAVRGGLNHDSVVRRIFGTNLLLILLATLATLDPELGPLYTALAYFAVFTLMNFFRSAEPEAA